MCAFDLIYEGGEGAVGGVVGPERASVGLFVGIYRFLYFRVEGGFIAKVGGSTDIFADLDEEVVGRLILVFWSDVRCGSLSGLAVESFLSCEAAFARSASAEFKSWTMRLSLSWVGSLVAAFWIFSQSFFCLRFPGVSAVPSRSSYHWTFSSSLNFTGSPVYRYMYQKSKVNGDVPVERIKFPPWLHAI